MRKKLDTRFPAARIKKIMQADEDVGKIAMAVPLLVSKALELFLQDLCDRTYEITLRRGAKTVNSLHLKQCVQNFNVFDFLRDIVSRVPDLGRSEGAGEGSAHKKRKVIVDEDNHGDEEYKKSHAHETGHASGSGRGRGRGKGRGKGRGSRTVSTSQYGKFEDDPDISEQNNDEKNMKLERLENGANPGDSKDSSIAKNSDVPVQNFDLNMDLNENGDSMAIYSGVTSKTQANFPVEMKHEEYPGWSLADMQSMSIDPIQLSKLNQRVDEEEEDYDEEG